MGTLYVVTCIANPIRWRSRTKLYADFEQCVLDSGAKLTTVECAYGDQDFELGNNQHVKYVRTRATGIHKVWIKENLQNLGIYATPEAKYIATIDADVLFRDANWVRATLDALQHFHVIQPWSYCYDLGPNGEHLATHTSFCKLVYEGKPIVQGPNASDGYQFGHPGYAWAYTRQALEWGGGLIETAALGAADHHQALALINKVGDSIHGAMTEGYKTPLYQWQKRMYQHVAGHLGALGGTIEHAWHGSKSKRAYVDRWDILARNKFDPSTDLKRNTFGVMELSGNKPQLSHDIDQYFRQRDEDSNSLG